MLSGAKESKNARKKRQRREAMVEAAANEELAEISLEQQVLRELSPVKASGKRFNAPLSFNIADMINAHPAEVSCASGCMHCCHFYVF